MTNDTRYSISAVRWALGLSSHSSLGLAYAWNFCKAFYWQDGGEHDPEAETIFSVESTSSIVAEAVDGYLRTANGREKRDHAITPRDKHCRADISY